MQNLYPLPKVNFSFVNTFVARFLWCAILGLMQLSASGQPLNPSNTLTWQFPLSRTHTGVPMGNGKQGLLIWGNNNQLNITIARAAFWDRRGRAHYNITTNYATVKKLLTDNNEPALNQAFGIPPTGEDKSRRSKQIGGGRLEIMLPAKFVLQQAVLNVTTGTVSVQVQCPDNILREIRIKQSVFDEIAWVDFPEALTGLLSIKLIPSGDFVGDILSKTGINPPAFWDVKNASSTITGFTQPLPEDDDLAIAYTINNNRLKIGTSLGDDAKTTLCKRIAETDLAVAEKKSNAWWADYWKSVPVLNLPDTALQQMALIGLYKQACSTPPHGVACALQGPFMEEYQLPPWSNDYHFNINIQMIYWSALASNRVEHFAPLWDMVATWLPTLRKYGETFFQNPKAILFPHAVDDGGHVISGFWSGTIDHATSAWVAQLAWLTYRYSMNDSVLRKIAWPLITGSFEGYWSMLEKRTNANGSYEYYLPVSVSPEWKGRRMDAWGENASFQLAAIHSITEILPKMATILGEKTDPRWADVKNHTPLLTSAVLPETLEYPEIKSERIVLWKGMDLVESHRHHSHLAGIYPFKTINPLLPANKTIAKNTLNHWLLMGNGQWASWSLPWSASLLLQYGYADASIAYLHHLYQYGYNEGKATSGSFTANGLGYKNGTDWGQIPFGAKHNEIMQLDATFGALNSILEILVQNRNDTIQVLPFIPKGWSNFSFSGVLAEGAFLVSAEVNAGAIHKIKVTCKKGGQLNLSHNLGNKFLYQDVEYQGSVFKKMCAPGETIVLQKINTVCRMLGPSHFPLDSVQKIVQSIKKITIPDKEINIIEYSGHHPDTEGSYDFRADIQRAVDELSAKGGGRLLFPHTRGADAWGKVRERYRIAGPVELRSNIEITLQPSVVLQFECNPVAYSNRKNGVITRYEGTTIYGMSPLFRAMGAENIVFSSTGGTGATPEINGDGEKWLSWQAKNESLRVKGQKTTVAMLRDLNNNDIPLRQRRVANPDSFFLRPVMFQFFLCRNILMDGIKLTDGPFWMVHPVFSQNLTFRNLIFDANVINNDGIDVESCKDVLIENIMFNNHDDNVVIKSGRDREGREGVLVTGTPLEKIPSAYIKNDRLTGCSENIVVRNSVFKGHNAFCVGSEMSGNVRNVYAIDNVAPQEVKMGIYIKSSRKRGGVVENIFVKNFAFNHVGLDVISINPNYDGDTVSLQFPMVRNIYIENVTASQANNGIRVYGWKEKPTENVVLKNIQIKLMPQQGNNTGFQSLHANGLWLNRVNINGTLFEN